jgi:hypothetical protein
LYNRIQIPLGLLRRLLGNYNHSDGYCREASFGRTN